MRQCAAMFLGMDCVDGACEMVDDRFDRHSFSIRDRVQALRTVKRVFQGFHVALFPKKVDNMLE